MPCPAHAQRPLDRRVDGCSHRHTTYTTSSQLGSGQWFAETQWASIHHPIYWPHRCSPLLVGLDIPPHSYIVLLSRQRQRWEALIEEDELFKWYPGQWCCFVHFWMLYMWKLFRRSSHHEPAPCRSYQSTPSWSFHIKTGPSASRCLVKHVSGGTDRPLCQATGNNHSTIWSKLLSIGWNWIFLLVIPLRMWGNVNMCSH